VLCFPVDVDIQFNLTHPVELALFAVTSGTTVGVDIEHIHVIAEGDEIVTRYFSLHEATEWRSLCSKEKPQAFLMY
jgi:phosphopantetheinyl transferase